MAHHLNIDTTYGVTVPANSEAESASRTQTVAINELLDSGTAEIISLKPVNVVNIEVQVEGEGPAALTITAGTIADPTTVTETSVELSEAPNNRCRFSIRAAAADEFTDPGTAEESVGAEPTVADLTVTSVTYSVAESVRRSITLEDKVLIGTAGTPVARETCTRRKPFAISGRGDLPAGVALGTGGAKFYGAATGVTVAGVLRESEKRGDWNGWGIDGMNAPGAS